MCNFFFLHIDLHFVLQILGNALQTLMEADFLILILFLVVVFCFFVRILDLCGLASLHWIPTKVVTSNRSHLQESSPCSYCVCVLVKYCTGYVWSMVWAWLLFSVISPPFITLMKYCNSIYTGFVLLNYENSFFSPHSFSVVSFTKPLGVVSVTGPLNDPITAGLKHFHC